MSVVMHIPHSSARIPAEVRDQFLLNERDLAWERRYMTDWFTDILFGVLPNAVKVKFPVSRLVVDPERFIEDDDEAMAMVGMGVVYTHTSHGGRLRRALSAAEREQLLSAYYRPHHERFATCVQSALNQFDRCLIIDAHSFPSKSLPYEISEQAARPEICIGTDPFHTPHELIMLVKEVFEEEGFQVAVDTPFSGAIVPAAFFKQDDRVHSVMIEVRRDLYMDEDLGWISDEFGFTRYRLQRALFRLQKYYEE